MRKTVNVTVKIGNTVHPKYGRLEKGQKLLIDEADLAPELFERMTMPMDEVEQTESEMPGLSGAEEKED